MPGRAAVADCQRLADRFVEVLDTYSTDRLMDMKDGAVEAEAYFPEGDQWMERVLTNYLRDKRGVVFQ